MDEYQFNSISLPRLIMLLIVSIVIIFVVTIFTFQQSHSSLLALVVFIIIFGICALCTRKLALKKITAKLNDNYIIIINGRQLSLTELGSFNFEKTPYVDKTILRFPNVSYQFYTAFKSESFQKFKRKIQRQINEVNQNRQPTEKIHEHNFYNSKYAKPYAWITLSLIIIWLLGMILYPEKATIANFGLFLLVVSGLSTPLIRILRTKK